MTTNNPGSLFSFDIGTNSIGWAVLRLNPQNEPVEIVDAGARIFSDGREPKSGTSLAEGRRVARGMSRRRDRYKRRRKAVLRTLTEFGLMPDTDAARKALVAETNDKTFDQIAANVYALRARALDEKLSPFHLGRALFHLNQRRGFKSNRKADRTANENEGGKIVDAVARLDQEMMLANARTLGELLHLKRGPSLKRKALRTDADPDALGHVRVRAERVVGPDDKEVDGYGFYPDRKMLEREFGRIWEAQSSHHPALLTDERRDHLFEVMFFQRPLKRPKVGKCSFNPDEERLPKAHPLFQEFRLYKELNELEIVHRGGREEKLTLEQRDLLATLLKSQRSSALKALRGRLKLPVGTRFNKETDVRETLKGDEVAAEMSHADRFGQAWFSMPLAERWAVIEMLLDTDDPVQVRLWLETRYGLESDRIEAIAAAKLPTGYGRLGPTALGDMLEELRKGTKKDGDGRDVVLTERQAMENIWGNNPAVKRTIKNARRLPPYQEVLSRRIPPGTGEPDDPIDMRLGRITNPTVHIGLNQLRAVVNRLIDKHGRPGRIALELGRDLSLSDDQKKKLNFENNKNRKAAEARSLKIDEHNAELRRAGVAAQIEDSGYNRVLLKLWERLNPWQPLNRVCIYCGGPILESSVFTQDVDVDHILPWSRTMDDGINNRLLCHARCNREKRNFAPSEVPGWKGRYDEILARAENLPHAMQWRFAPDAMQRFEKDRDFLARQMTDTQYLARLAHDYLAALFEDEELDGDSVVPRRNHVVVVTGRMTALLRRRWRLDALLNPGMLEPDDSDLSIEERRKRRERMKNRNDHRHHAVDAAVIGVTTRSLLQRIATAAGKGEEAGIEETIGKIEPPWETFRDDLKRVIDRIVVSHKPDHGSLPKAGQGGHTAGQLHNDTAYGFTYEDRDGERVVAEKNGVPIVVRSVPFMSLTEKDIGAIRDRPLADALFRAIRGLSGKDLAAALEHFRADGPYKNIRHVRVTEVVSVVPIRDPSGHPYKGYASGGNYRFDVWELPDGKWDAEVVSMFDAHQPSFQSRMRLLHHNPRKIMSLTIGDMVAYESPETGQTIVARVRKFDQRNKQIYFDKHNEAGKLDERHADPDDSFRNFSKTPNALRGIKARQIRVDEIGRVFDPGPQDRDSRLARRQAGVTAATGAG